MKESPSFFHYFSDKDLNFVYQLLDNNGNIKSWRSIKEEFGIGKLNPRQLYSLLVYNHPLTPISQKYLNELLKTDSFDWKEIYLLPRLVTRDSYSCSFQYKILNNFLYLNKKSFMFRKSTSLLCSFCKLSDETVLHLFYEYNILLALQNELVLLFGNKFTFFDPTPQAAFLDFLMSIRSYFTCYWYFQYIFTILGDLSH